VDRREVVVHLTVEGGVDEATAELLAEELLDAAGADTHAVIDLVDANLVGQRPVRTLIERTRSRRTVPVGLIVRPGEVGVGDHATARAAGWTVGAETDRVVAAVRAGAGRAVRATDA